MSGTLFTHPWASVFYLKLTGSSITLADLTTLAGEINTLWGTDIKPLLTADVTQTTADVRYIPTTGSELRAIATGTNVGTHTGATVQDASACHVVDLVIPEYYRGGHPRWYLPGVAAPDVSNGSLVSSAVQSSVATNVQSFITAMNAYTVGTITGVSIGTVRFQSAGAWLTPPVFVAFAGVRYGKNGKIGSQRRRIIA